MLDQSPVVPWLSPQPTTFVGRRAELADPLPRQPRLNPDDLTIRQSHDIADM